MGIEISLRLNQCVIAISSAGGRQEGLFSKPAAEKAMTTNLSVFPRLALWLLKLYQSRMSPHMEHRCLYHPTCSEYAQLAIRKYGFIKG